MIADEKSKQTCIWIKYLIPLKRIIPNGFINVRNYCRSHFNEYSCTIIVVVIIIIIIISGSNTSKSWSFDIIIIYRSYSKENAHIKVTIVVVVVIAVGICFEYCFIDLPLVYKCLLFESVTIVCQMSSWIKRNGYIHWTLFIHRSLITS